LDSRLRTAHQIENIAALPLIGVVPRIAAPSSGYGLFGSNRLLDSESETHASAIIINARPRVELLESYRALRMSLFQSPEGPPQVIMVTSSLPSEGKTTTSINCAVVLAQQGKPVLLVDCDLRAPRIHKALEIRAASGLAALLSEKPGVSDRQVIVHYSGVPNLHVLPAGRVQGNVWELLDSTVMKRKIAEWRQLYSHIIIDTPPVLSYSDALVLSAEADSVLLTISAGQTPRAALLRARDLLIGVNAKLTGVVVNGVDANSSDFCSYGYYGYERTPKRSSNQ
jgi:succinoglycan biosynthesis transport protein ExoP